MGTEGKAGVKKKEKKGIRRLKFLFRFIFKVCMLALIGWAILTYVLGLYRVTGNNMFPSMKDGDLCVLYKLDECYTNDVVLYEDSKGQVHLGRVVAVPGQTVDFPEEGGYLVNSYQLSEEITYPTYKSEKSKVKFPIELGDGEYFVLNDFRTDTSDGRELGAISKSSIKGKLIFLLRRRGF